MTREEQQAEQATIIRRCRGPRLDLGEGPSELRAGCGYDFNRILLAGPFDGEEHEYECPKCGVTGTYTAPLYPEEDSAEATPA